MLVGTGKRHQHNFQGVMITMSAGRVVVLVDGKLDLTQNTVVIKYLSYTSRNALLVPAVVMVYTVYVRRLYEIRRFPRKFCTDWVKLPCS